MTNTCVIVTKVLIGTVLLIIITPPLIRTTWAVKDPRGTNNKNHPTVKDPRGTNNKTPPVRSGPPQAENFGDFRCKFEIFIRENRAIWLAAGEKKLGFPV